MIYLDNSASTFVKPKQVIKAVNCALTKYCANPGRSGHKASISAAMEVQRVREKLSSHFNLCLPQNVVFTQNCTEALNIAILGLAREGGNVVCTENDHNSVLRPLHHLAEQQKISFTVAKQSQKGRLSVDDIKKHIKPNTYMVICNHISNVNGDIADIEQIGAFCKKHSLIFVVDAAQSGGHKKIDMQKCNIDLLTLAGHKGFFAPQSIGALLVGENVLPSPLKFGGTGTNSLDPSMPSQLPERLEAGTLPTPSILGFGAGVDFVEQNYDNIVLHLDDLTTYLNYELSKLPVDVYTQPENSFGVLAFNIPGFDSAVVANHLDSRGICVRGGLHCAPEKHKALGTTKTGAVRVSFCCFNTLQDAVRLVNEIKRFLRQQKMI